MEWQLEAFESRTSLWRLIEEFVPESERLEIKEALGEDLVDETLDLQNEVRSYFQSCTVKLICTLYTVGSCMDRLIIPANMILCVDAKIRVKKSFV